MTMTQVARPWLAFLVSGSATSLGLVAAAQGFMMLVASPLGGVAADRLPKRIVLLVSQASLLLTAIVMFLIVFFDVAKIWHLVLLSVVHGGTVPFNQPVRQSYIPLLLPRSAVPNGVALQTSARTINQILAPAAIGILLAVEPWVAFLLIAVMHFVSMIASLRLPLGRPLAEVGKGMGGELLFGLRYIAGHQVLRVLILMGMVAVALGVPYQQLLPVFQKEVLGVGEIQLGFMYTMVGLGGLVATLGVASFPGVALRGFPQLVAGVAFGLALMLFALTTWYPLALATLFMVGFSAQSYMTMNQTLIMMNTDPGMYGRVASVNIMVRSLFPMIVLPMGMLVDAFGPGVTVASSGGILALSILVIGAFRREMWRSRAF
jgi:MFS family permease